jgi:NADP-dependent 3-hydroxy acid dehydrogenase YdfG
MKTMLIAGASRGIGLACASEFAVDYNVLTISRSSGATFQGDLNDASFRQEILANVIPDVFICVAKLTYEATQELLVKFYGKMLSGHIILVGSTAGNINCQGLEQGLLKYVADKNATQNLARLLSDSARSKVKVTSLEPGYVMTDFGEVRQRYLDKKPKDPIALFDITPMDPSYLAKTIRWILAQPEEVVIKTLEIANAKQL